MKQSSICIIIPYFGHWPEWFNLFLQSCQYNNTINWLFVTDCGLPERIPDNTEFIEIAFNDYKKMVSKRLDIDFSQAEPYKLCDLKPTYGYIHEEYLTQYNFFGFGDIDIIYGNIRHFITEDILENHQLISTHSNRISGHFCLLKNNNKMRNAFRRIHHWKSLIENPEHLGIDESKFTKVFLPHRKHPQWLKTIYGWFSPYWRNNFFHEQYSTILSPIKWFNGRIEHPQEWLWEYGQLTNSSDEKKEFMYLHFMNWKSSKWLDKQYRNRAAWENMSDLVKFDATQKITRFWITPKGFLK